MFYKIYIITLFYAFCAICQYRVFRSLVGAKNSADVVYILSIRFGGMRGIHPAAPDGNKNLSGLLRNQDTFQAEKTG